MVCFFYYTEETGFISIALLISNGKDMKIKRTIVFILM